MRECDATAHSDHIELRLSGEIDDGPWIRQALNDHPKLLVIDFTGVTRVTPDAIRELERDRARLVVHGVDEDATALFAQVAPDVHVASDSDDAKAVVRSKKRAGWIVNRFFES